MRVYKCEKYSENDLLAGKERKILYRMRLKNWYVAYKIMEWWLKKMK